MTKPPTPWRLAGDRPAVATGALRAANPSAPKTPAANQAQANNNAKRTAPPRYRLLGNCFVSQRCR